MLTLLQYLKKRLDKFWADQNVMFDWTADITGTGAHEDGIRTAVRGAASPRQ